MLGLFCVFTVDWLAYNVRKMSSPRTHFTSYAASKSTQSHTFSSKQECCTERFTLGLHVNIPFIYLITVRDYFTVGLSDAEYASLHKVCSRDVILKHVWQRRFIILLLLLAGNVELNPGPEPECLYIPSDFAMKPGLKVVHLNVRSLVPKIDFVRLWAVSANADVFALSETWLKKTVSDNDVAISGYNIYRADRRSKGGGVVLYVKSAYHVTPLKSMSITKSFELLAINLKLGNTNLVVACCYRPPSATCDTLSSLSSVLTEIISY